MRFLKRGRNRGSPSIFFSCMKTKQLFHAFRISTLQVGDIVQPIFSRWFMANLVAITNTGRGKRGDELGWGLGLENQPSRATLSQQATKQVALTQRSPLCHKVYRSLAQLMMISSRKPAVQQFAQEIKYSQGHFHFTSRGRNSIRISHWPGRKGKDLLPWNRFRSSDLEGMQNRLQPLSFMGNICLSGNFSEEVERSTTFDPQNNLHLNCQLQDVL